MLQGFTVVFIGFPRGHKDVLSEILVEFGASSIVPEELLRKISSLEKVLCICSLDAALPNGLIHPAVSEFWLHESVAAGELQPYEDFPLVAKWKPVNLSNIYHINGRELLVMFEEKSADECPSQASLAVIKRFLSTPVPSYHNRYKLPAALVPLVQQLPRVCLKDWISGGLSNITTLAVVEFVSFLVELNYLEIDKILMSSGTMDALFRIFVRYPFENILHLAISRTYIEILQNNHQELRNYLIFTLKLLDIIDAKIEDDFFRPHFTEITNCFANMIQVCKNYTKLIENTNSQKLFDEKLTEINKRNVSNKWKEEAEVKKRTPRPQSLPRDSFDYEHCPLNIVSDQPKKTFTCAYCHDKAADNSIQCPKCRALTYCSRDCQKKHWREGHSKSCGS